MGEENRVTEPGDSQTFPKNAILPVPPLLPEKGTPPESIRQWMAWRADSFNSRAAGRLRADIQFRVSGTQPGDYVLRIADGRYEAYEGTVPSPSLTVHTPAEVWLKIARGELAGPEAYAKGMHMAEGDLGLLLRLRALLYRNPETAQEAQGSPREAAATPGRPEGPLRLKGIAWLQVAFLPWYLHWVSGIFLPAGPGRYWTGVVSPLVLAALLWTYRRIFGRSTLFDAGTLVYFVLFNTSLLVHNGFFVAYADPLSMLTVALLWTASLVTSMPLTLRYIRWDYPPAMWTNAVFRRLNAGITGGWAVIFLLNTAVALAAHYAPAERLPGLLIRLPLLASGIVFTHWYRNWYVSYGVVRETGG